MELLEPIGDEFFLDECKLTLLFVHPDLQLKKYLPATSNLEAAKELVNRIGEARDYAQTNNKGTAEASNTNIMGSWNWK